MQLLFVAVFVYTATLSKGFGKNNVYQDSFPIHGFFNCVFGKFNETSTKQLKEWVQSAVYRVKQLQVVEKYQVNVLKGCSAKIDCWEIYD